MAFSAFLEMCGRNSTEERLDRAIWAVIGLDLRNCFQGKVESSALRGGMVRAIASRHKCRCDISRHSFGGTVAQRLVSGVLAASPSVGSVLIEARSVPGCFSEAATR
ncbi:MAG: hypothetical protein KatS3mg077_2894 [Candidatus Binatia bacterium]|nr:MAG: hypothetical protein KatS3mg077_2894 [Candidatus Binatia bacterium]